MGGGALYLECYVRVVVGIFSEPDSREVTPTELLDDHIAIYEHFPHMHRVIPADFVVREALILGRVAVFIANTS